MAEVWMELVLVKIALRLLLVDRYIIVTLCVINYYHLMSV